MRIKKAKEATLTTQQKNKLSFQGGNLPDPNRQQVKTYRAGRHLIDQLIPNPEPKQLDLFADNIIEEIKRNSTSLALSDILIDEKDTDSVKGQQIDIIKMRQVMPVFTVVQGKVFHAILKAFDATNYEGNRMIEKMKISNDPQNIRTSVAYRDIERIPIIEITQSKLLELAGMSRSHGDKKDMIEALKFFQDKKYIFYWKRLRRDKKGNPIIDDGKKYIYDYRVKEEPLIQITHVFSPDGKLRHYEITPSAVMIDQINQHYINIPENLTNLTKTINGKRETRYPSNFLLYLVNAYQVIKSHNDKQGKLRKNKSTRALRPYEISQTWQDIAFSLQMPESMFKANKARALKILDDVYKIAIQEGYLTKVDTTGVSHKLYLNADFYSKNGKSEL